jgi:hypothetical protein
MAVRDANQYGRHADAQRSAAPDCEAPNERAYDVGGWYFTHASAGTLTLVPQSKHTQISAVEWS